MRFPTAILKRADIRDGEVERVLLMTTTLLIIIASYMIVKAVRDSLFVSAIGPSQLPYVYILIAAAMGGVSMASTRAVHRLGLSALIQYTLLVAFSNLLLFWWGFQHRSVTLFYVLYVWVSIFGAVTASQFWLLANYVFNAREARRQFGWLALGGILGGILGGTATKVFAPRLGTESLLAIVAALVLCTLFLVRRIVHIAPVDKSAEAQPGGHSPDASATHIFRQVRRSRHLSLLMILLTLSVIVEALIDYEYKFSARQAFHGKDQLTAFFGTVTAYIGVFSLLFQIVLTGPILKRFGAGAAILFLPAGLLVASIALVLYPGVGAAAALQMVDGSLGYSIHRSGMELLYLPIASRIKNAVKHFIDTFVDRAGRALGGVLLLLFTSVLALSLSSLSAVTSGLVALWIAAAILVKREYIQSFRAALEKKTIRPEALHADELDNVTIRTLVAALSSADDRQVLYALDVLAATHPRRWLSSVDVKAHRPSLSDQSANPQSPLTIRAEANPKSAPSARMVNGDWGLADWSDKEGLRALTSNRNGTPVSHLTRHQSSAVRTRIVAVLAQWRDGSVTPLISELLNDPDVSVRAEAIRYLCRNNPNFEEAIQTYLRHSDYSIVHAAIRCAATDPDVPSRRWELSLRHEHILQSLLYNQSIDIRREAIITAGVVQYEAAIPILIDKLQEPRLRADASNALSQFGPAVIDSLGRVLRTPAAPLAVRLRIPKVLANIGRQECADLLVGALHRFEYDLDYRLMKAMNRMRVASDTITFAPTMVQAAIERETEDHRQLRAIVHSIRLDARSIASQRDALLWTAPAAADSLSILIKAAEERLQQRMERIFRLLALIYPARDIYSTYYACLVKPAFRPDAIEFLDNLMEPRTKPILLPLIEEAFELRSVEITDAEQMSLEAALNVLSTGSDPWLRIIATDVAGRLRVAA